MPRRAVDERLLVVTKYFLAFKLKRGCKASGVKRIRVHVILHSHVSLHLFPTKQDEMAVVLDGARG